MRRVILGLLVGVAMLAAGCGGSFDPREIGRAHV